MSSFQDNIVTDRSDYEFLTKYLINPPVLPCKVMSGGVISAPTVSALYPLEAVAESQIDNGAN